MPTTSEFVSRQALAAELEGTRMAYHALLDEIPADAWEQPSGNPAWNIREIAYHMTMAAKNLPLDIKLIRSRRMFTPPAWLFNRLNISYTRRKARKQTPAKLRIAYDMAHADLITLLDNLRDGELLLSGNYPNLNDNMPGGKHTIAQMFQYVTLHFWEHEADIRVGLAQYAAKPQLPVPVKHTRRFASVGAIAAVTASAAAAWMFVRRRQNEDDDD
jgi:uncharacterized damage-inducible protein DinB